MWCTRCYRRRTSQFCGQTRQAILLSAIEYHVLQEVRDTGVARMLISRSDTKEKVESHTRYVMVLDKRAHAVSKCVRAHGKILSLHKRGVQPEVGRLGLLFLEAAGRVT